MLGSGGWWLHWCGGQRNASCSSLLTIGACFTHTQGQGHDLISGNCRASLALNPPVHITRDTFQEELCRGLGRDIWLWQWQMFTWGWWQRAMPPSEVGTKVLPGKILQWLLIAEVHRDCRLRRICFQMCHLMLLPHGQKGRKGMGCAWNSSL